MKRLSTAFPSLVLHGVRACSSTSTAVELPPQALDGEPLNTNARRGEWVQAMQEKYGEGAFQLFRPLYRDLVDEMRREANTAPPTPKKGWSVALDDKVNLVVARREANAAEKTGRVVAYTNIKMANPPKLHQGMYMADFFPVEALVERNGVIMHFSSCAIDRRLHLRNVRAYAVDALGPGTDIMSLDANVLWSTHNLLYDGPCLWHLEVDMLNEMYELMMDHAVDMDFVLWMGDWATYAEHVAATRWMLGLMDAVIPEDRRGGEEDFLLEEEMEELSNPPPDYTSSRD
ncbi:Hypothetical protein, putative [Bodo saltans]|uniref:Uncharacterized protein n=1 Tax=Bodo saltans TaxID=75058 RepID=A0A0S4JKT7_BODSA|nr:Hypothetical protein, putative [Bodo saltans]|eukprot:CUG90007.1 Hypothetical protein, putative [Bodo saltans]